VKHIEGIKSEISSYLMPKYQKIFIVTQKIFAHCWQPYCAWNAEQQ